MANLVDHDVVVLGGGPAGASAAGQLARFGLDVAILERLPFPRKHVGICIADQTVELASYLGLPPGFVATMSQRRMLTAVRWGSDDVQFASNDGFHVDRGQFDLALMDRARILGAQIYQPAHIASVARGDGGNWHLQVVASGVKCDMRAKFLVDAGGRRPALGGRRKRIGPPLISLHARWQLDREPEYDGLVEAGENAWVWFARTGPKQAEITLFCDPKDRGVTRQSSLQDHYACGIDDFRALRSCSSGQQLSRVTPCDASSYCTTDAAGQKHICVGDACHSVDPLASQGVHLAMLSGIQASIIVHTLLRKPENEKPALQFHSSRRAEQVESYREFTKMEYAKVGRTIESKFWLERSGGDTPGLKQRLVMDPGPLPFDGRYRICSMLTIDEIPALAGDFVELKTAIRHPNVSRPVAYLQGMQVAPLLSTLAPSFSFPDLTYNWGNRISQTDCRKLAQWLWSKRIFVTAK